MRRLDIHLHLPAHATTASEIHIHLHEDGISGVKDTMYDAYGGTIISSSRSVIVGGEAAPTPGQRRGGIVPRLLRLGMSEDQPKLVSKLVMAKPLGVLLEQDVLLEQLSSSPELHLWESLGGQDVLGEIRLQVTNKINRMIALLTLANSEHTWICGDWTARNRALFLPVAPADALDRLPRLVTTPEAVGE